MPHDLVLFCVFCLSALAQTEYESACPRNLGSMTGKESGHSWNSSLGGAGSIGEFVGIDFDHWMSFNDGEPEEAAAGKILLSSDLLASIQAR
jgi:hypothetical protein